MSITAYSRFRRQNLRRAWHFSGMTEWCLNVGLYILAFVAILAFLGWADSKAAAEDAAYAAQKHAERMAEHAEQTILSCLNHKGVWVDGSMHTCSLADTRLSRSDFK